MALRIAALLLLAFLLFSRLSSISSKPYHHDESIHAVESWKYATTGAYKFDPMLHGPLLYHYVAAIYSGFPINDGSGRVAVALTGIVFALAGLALFRKQGAKAQGAWLALVTLSPIFCFYSRTFIHDSLVCMLVVLLLLSAMRFHETGRKGYLFICSGLFSLLVCTKLNFLIYAFCFLTFVPVLYGFDWRKTLEETKRFLFQYRYQWLGAFLLFALIYSLLYSSLGRYGPGISDGIFRMFRYWSEQNRVQRIKGPFDYYFWILAIYELPVLLACIGLALYAARKEFRGKEARVLIGLSFVLVLTLILRNQWNYLRPTFDRVMHMTQWGYPALALAEIIAWYCLTRFHLRKGEMLSAFSAHWGMLSLMIYSYAGEKVPWLSTHILLPWFIYLASQAIHLKRAAFACLVPVMLWQGFILYRANFILVADPRERLVYTHTSWDMIRVVDRIKHLSEVTGERYRLRPQVVGAAAWPLYWYLRDYPSWYRLSINERENPPLIVDDLDQGSLVSLRLKDRYTAKRYKLREWWVPDITKMTVSNAIQYYLTREVYNPTGSQDIMVYTRNDLADK